MAGDWIKLRANLWDDPKVNRIADELGVSESTVIGCVYWLWAMADGHTIEGDIKGLTKGTIDRKVGLPGFSESLVCVDWLNEDENGVLTIPRFGEHNGTSAKKRCQNTLRKSKSRSLSPPERDQSATREEKSKLLRSEAGKEPAEPPCTSPSDKKMDGSVFESLRPSDLTEPVSLKLWFAWQSKQPGGIYVNPGTADADLLNVLSLARQALAKGDNPLGLFCSLIGKRTEAMKKFSKEIT